MNLFAYGTLIDPEIMRKVAGELPRHAPAVLYDYERKILRDRPYPGIRAKAGSAVRGLLYFDISAQGLDRLDRFEGKMYIRTEVSVIPEGGAAVAAWTYILSPGFEGELCDADWSYEDFLREGKAAFESGYEGFRRSA